MQRGMARLDRNSLAGISATASPSVQVICHSCWHRGALRWDAVMSDATGTGLDRQIRCAACLSPDVDVGPQQVEYEIE